MIDKEKKNPSRWIIFLIIIKTQNTTDFFEEYHLSFLKELKKLKKKWETKNNNLSNNFYVFIIREFSMRFLAKINE